MDIILSKARVEVDDVFEDLINDIDVKVERFFIENKARIRSNNEQPDPLFVRINKWREACIVEIRECKDYNLSLIDIKTAELPLEQQIKRFCFLASFVDTIFNSDNQFGYTLFSTDKYLKREEITCFEALLKFMPGAEHNPEPNPKKYRDEKGQFLKSVHDLLIGVQEFLNYPFYIRLKVKNNSGLIDCLRPESTQPNLVKAPSDTLFAFDELAFDFTFDSIQPDAKFLFAQLTRFKIQANSVSFSDNSLMRIINQFKSVSTSTESNIFEKEDLHLYWCAFKGATCENNQITQLSLCNTNFRFYGQWPNLKKLSLFLFPTFKSDWNLFKSFPNLEKLVIKNTESYDISQYDLLSCFAHGESLKRLAIRANTVGCIEKLAHCFPQLEELDLSGSSNLHTIGPNAFLNFPHLKKLNLSNCSIRNVDRGAFSHLLNLDELDLSFNTDLTTLQMNGPVVPSVLKAICCLKLAKVKLLNSPSSSVIDKLLFPFTGFQMTLEGPSHLFVNTKMLEISLTYGMSFDLFSALEELTLRIANFGDVKRGQLANLICLKKLQFECESKLDSLYDQELDGRIFEGLVSVTKLTISNFQSIHVLRKNTFSSLPKLECLQLIGNGINSIEPGAFGDLTKLRQLNIHGNYKDACPRLIELANVEILDLARGSIKFVDQLFAGMTSNAVNTKLRVLDLSSNKLTSLKANAFSRLVGLARLDLRANEIELLENGAFSGLVNLQELNFSFHDRAMKPLDLAVFGDEPDLANLRFINLSDSNDKRVDSIVSSVDPSKLFAHYRHRVVVQATRLILQAQGAYKLFDGLLQNGHIFLTVPYRSTLQRARLILD